MRVFDGSAAAAGATRGCVLTIGNFDGLHLGHQALLGEVVSRARAAGRLAAAYTFDPHPRRILEPGRPHVQLMTRGQLEQGLRELGIDAWIREPFTRELAALAPAVFVEKILAERIGPCELWVGRDFRFGHSRSGSDAMLAELGPRFGFQVRCIEQVSAAGGDVSSTRVRERVAQGDVAEARRLLGHPYTVWGRVVRGEGRGKALGFPTANLEPESELLPARGVYATRVQLLRDVQPHGEVLDAVSNIGQRPTFAGEGTRLETHVLGPELDLYGLRIAVEFWQRLRDEQTFAGPVALREQLERDCRAARAALHGAAAR